MNAVRLVQVSTTAAELQWSSSTSHDMIADSALAVLLSIDASPATVKCKFNLKVVADGSNGKSTSSFSFTLSLSFQTIPLGRT